MRISWKCIWRLGGDQLIQMIWMIRIGLSRFPSKYNALFLEWTTWMLLYSPDVCVMVPFLCAVWHWYQICCIKFPHKMNGPHFCPLGYGPSCTQSLPFVGVPIHLEAFNLVTLTLQCLCDPNWQVLSVCRFFSHFTEIALKGFQMLSSEWIKLPLLQLETHDCDRCLDVWPTLCTSFVIFL